MDAGYRAEFEVIAKMVRRMIHAVDGDADQVAAGVRLVIGELAGELPEVTDETRASVGVVSVALNWHEGDAPVTVDKRALAAVATLAEIVTHGR